MDTIVFFIAFAVANSLCVAAGFFIAYRERSAMTRKYKQKMDLALQEYEKSLKLLQEEDQKHLEKSKKDYREYVETLNKAYGAYDLFSHVSSSIPPKKIN